jgi:phage terminase small subunit
MKGRKEKPTNVHLLNGTYRKDRHGKQHPQPSTDLPKPPKALSKRAKQIFKLFVKRMEGWASKTHTEIIAICAQAHEEAELCNRVLTTEDGSPSFSYVTSNSFGDKILKARPEVSQRRAAWRQAQSLLIELGLTPASARKVEKTSGNEQPKKEGRERFFR